MREHELLVAADAEFAATGAAWLAARIEEAVAARGRCTLALAGGTTPAPVYGALAETHGETLPWDRVELYFGDERCVPPDHAESNYRMVREALVERLPGARPSVHRMEGEEPNADRAARRYEELLPGVLDVVVLGMGADGHTASLFPGSQAFEHPERRVLAVSGPKPPSLRLTITPTVIELARDVLVLVRGTEKAERLAEVLHAPVDPHARPVQLALRGTWLVDPAAAGRGGTGSAGAAE